MILRTVLFLCFASLLTPCWGAADFPLFRGDPARTGFLAQGPTPPLELRWKFKTRHGRGQIEGHPGVDDGLSTAVVVGKRVFVGGHDGYLYALDVMTGKKIWEFKTGGRVVSTPAWHDGRLFFGSTDNFVYALRASDGKLLWKYASGYRLFRNIRYGGVRSSPVSDGRTVWIGGCDGRIRALEAATGKPRWVLDAGTEGIYASPVLAGDTVYTASDGLEGSHLFALEAATGRVRWKVPLPEQIFATPALADGVLYLHVRDEGIYALRASDGGEIWKTPTTNPQGDFQVFTDLTKSSPAVDGARLWVGVGKELLALDRGTGKVLWRGVTRGKVDSSPLIVGGTVYVGSDDGMLYAFDGRGGATLWTFRTGGKISISPSAGAGMLFMGSNDGNLYAFAPASGR